jgi:hypothetical protein
MEMNSMVMVLAFLVGVITVVLVIIWDQKDKNSTVEDLLDLDNESFPKEKDTEIDSEN